MVCVEKALVFVYFYKGKRNFRIHVKSAFKYVLRSQVVTEASISLIENEKQVELSLLLLLFFKFNVLLYVYIFILFYFFPYCYQYLSRYIWITLASSNNLETNRLLMILRSSHAMTLSQPRLENVISAST